MASRHLRVREWQDSLNCPKPTVPCVDRAGAKNIIVSKLTNDNDMK